MLRSYLGIMLGGALGSVLRYAVSQYCAYRWGETFPVGTLIINITGSFLIGIFAGLSDTESRIVMGPHLRQFLMIGICGGYTTFSSFSLQTLNLARNGQWLYAGLNILLSVVLCLVGVWVGFALVQYMNRLR